MMAAGEICLESGEKVQAYWIFTDDGLELQTFEGLTVLKISAKEFIRLAEEYVTRD